MTPLGEGSPNMAGTSDNPPAPGGRAPIERMGLLLMGVALFALTWRSMDLLGDSFWSVATGRLILDQRALPETDPFSFTATGPWTVHMPLSQVAFAWTERLSGTLGLELFGTLVLVAALLLLWLPHARTDASRLIVWIGLCGLVWIQSDDLCVRGQLFGDLAFACVLLLCSRIRMHGAGSRLWFGGLGLALGCLWVNLHASVLLGVVLPMVWGVAVALLDARCRREAGALVMLGSFIALGSLVNPYGPRLPLDLLRLLFSSSTRRIDLFLPPDFSAPSTLLAFCSIAMVLVLRLASRERKERLAEAAILALLGLAGALGRRYLPLAVAAALVELGILVNAWRASSRLVTVLYVSACAVSTWMAFSCLAEDKDPWRDAPVDEAAFIEQEKLPDRVANMYHFGGYLDYAWNGRRKVFIDGRNQLFEGRVFDAHSMLARGQGWEKVLDEYGINTVLWERGSRLNYLLAHSQDWVLIARGRIAVVYVRRDRADTEPSRSPSK